MPRGGSRQLANGSAGQDARTAPACDPLLFERAVRTEGYLRVAGLDEAGRGPLAGPVVAAAVILPEGLLLPGVTDSKQLSARRREQLFQTIIENAASYGIGIVDERVIDEINIREASLLAMERAVESISSPPDYLLIDGTARLPRCAIPQRPIVKGDCLSHSIAAASILAKVTRDRMMLELDARFPQYRFGRHKGYGTAEHMALLREHGPCDAHRRTFEPIASMLRVDR